MFSLFFSDLTFEVIKETFNVGKWGTGFDLFFDLSKEVTEVSGLEGIELLVSLETEASCDEAKEEYGFHYDVVDIKSFLINFYKLVYIRVISCKLDVLKKNLEI